MRDPGEVWLGGGLADLADHEIDRGIGEETGVGAAFVGFGGSGFGADSEEEREDQPREEDEHPEGKD